MRLPRDLSGPELIRLLAKLGYAVTRQAGSHVRLTTRERGEHHITIPITPLCASAHWRRFSRRWPCITASTATSF